MQNYRKEGSEISTFERKNKHIIFGGKLSNPVNMNPIFGKIPYWNSKNKIE
jgi:hypothetical protein